MRFLVLLYFVSFSIFFPAHGAVNGEEASETVQMQLSEDFEVDEVELPEDYDFEDIDMWDVYFVDEDFLNVPLDEMSDAQIFGEEGLIYKLEEMEETAAKGKAKSKRKAKKRGAGRGCIAKDGGASWYGPGFQNNRTASGERFNPGALTAAHKSIRFGSLVRVTYRGRSVVVRINDNGPHVRGRVIDLSRAAAKAVGLLGAGSGHVSLQIVRCG